MFTTKEKQFMLQLAREAIGFYLETGKKLTVGEGEQQFAPTHRGVLIYAPTGALAEPHACFVTLTKDFELRGCMGHLEAMQPLYLDIIDNAIAAAFEDDRFFPVTKEELTEIQIEISVLTRPEPVTFSSPQELLSQLTVGVDGVIVESGTRNATYLPQVWDEILEKDNFMSSLCLKAGLEPDDWKKRGMKVWRYQVEIISEESFADIPARVG